MSQITAGNAFVVIGAIDRTAAVMNRIGMNLNKWGKSLESLGARMFLRLSMAAIPFGYTLKIFTEFDDVMRRVQGRTGAAGHEMQTLRKDARSFGTDLGYTAVQVAKLMDELAQKGTVFDAAGIEKSTRPILALAKSAGPGNVDDPTVAATIVAGVLNAYKLGATEAARVSDVLALAANKGNFALSDFVTSLGQAGPIAHQYGLSLEETVAVLAQLRDVNIDAEMAGTAFKNLMLYVSSAKGRDKFNETLKGLTGNTIQFVDAADNLRPIPSILFEIGNAIRGLGTATKGGMLDELFGKRAVVPAMILANNKNPFNNLLNQLNNSGGFAESSAATMESGIGGVLRRMLAALQELYITLNELLEPEIRKVGETLTNYIKQTTAWVAANKGAVIIALSLATATLALSVAFYGFGLVLSLVGSTLQILSVPLSLISGALNILLRLGTAVTTMLVRFAIQTTLLVVRLGILAAQMLVNAAVMVFYQSMILTINVMMAFSGAIVSVINTMSMMFSLLGATATVFPEIIGALLMLLAIGGALGLGEMLGDVFGWLSKIKDITVGPLFASIKAIGQGIWTWLAGFSSIFSNLFSNLGTTVQWAIEVGKAIYDALQIGDTKAAWEVFMSGIGVAWEMLMFTMRAFWDSTIIHIMEGLRSIDVGFRKMLEDLGTNEFFKGMMDVLMPGVNLFQGNLRQMLGMGSSDLTDAMWQGKIADKAEANEIGATNDIAKMTKKMSELRGVFAGLNAAAANRNPQGSPLLPTGLAPEAFPGMPNPIQQMESARLESLAALEAGSMEAAKAAYEANQKLEDIDIDMLDALEGILDNTDALKELRRA